MLLPAFLLLTGSVRAQSTKPNSTQFWFDYDPTFKLTQRFSLDAETAFHTAPSVPQPWYEFTFIPNIEYSPRRWIDFTGGLGLSRTHQTDSTGTFETKPYFGVRLNWHTRWRGIRVVSYSRWEFRFQRNLDTDETTNEKRVRNRLQLLIPLNTRDVSEDNTFNLILDAEAFRTPSKENVEERFKSRERYRAGIGWKRNAGWTFQFIYALQKSRNNIGSPFSEVDHIFRFRIIHTIKR